MNTDFDSFAPASDPLPAGLVFMGSGLANLVRAPEWQRVWLIRGTP